MSFKISNNIDDNKTTITLFKRAARIAGLDIPEFKSETINIPAFATAAEVADATLEVVKAGNDPAADTEVQRLLTSKLLGETTGIQYRQQVMESKAHMEHLREAAGPMLEDMADRFADAVHTMNEQIPIIGRMDLDDGLRQMDHLPDRKAHAIVSAHRANTTTRTLTEALPVITEAANGGNLSGGKYGLLAYCKPSLAQFNEHMLSSSSTMNTHGRKHNVWDILNDGIEVELATTNTEFQARIRRIENEIQNLSRDFRAEEAQTDIARHQAKAMGI